MTRISGKVVWITGASAGIGRATALQMAQKGARLILSARREAALEAVKNEIGLASEVLVLPLDMAKPADFEDAYERIKEQFGQVDILFNNAGISQRGRVEDTGLEVYEELMQVNFMSYVKLTKLVLPDMVAQKSGHIVVTSSLSGKLGTPDRSGYCASKHALHGFYDCLRAEVDHSNINVSIICPGYIKTDISKNALSPTGKKHGKMDANQETGLSAEFCAKQIVKAVEKNKSEIYIGQKEVLGVYLKRFFPKLLEKIILRQAPQ